MTALKCCGCGRALAGDAPKAGEQAMCFDCATLTEKVEARMRDDYGPLEAMLRAQGKLDPGGVR